MQNDLKHFKQIKNVQLSFSAKFCFEQDTIWGMFSKNLNPNTPNTQKKLIKAQSVGKILVLNIRKQIVLRMKRESNIPLMS